MDAFGERGLAGSTIGAWYKVEAHKGARVGRSSQGPPGLQLSPMTTQRQRGIGHVHGAYPCFRSTWCRHRRSRRPDRVSHCTLERAQALNGATACAVMCWGDGTTLRLRVAFQSTSTSTEESAWHLVAILALCQFRAVGEGSGTCGSALGKAPSGWITRL